MCADDLIDWLFFALISFQISSATWGPPFLSPSSWLSFRARFTRGTAIFSLATTGRSLPIAFHALASIDTAGHAIFV